MPPSIPQGQSDPGNWKSSAEISGFFSRVFGFQGLSHVEWDVNEISLGNPGIWDFGNMNTKKKP